MGQQAFAEAVQCVDVVPLQAVKQCAQPPMVRQGALHQWLRFRALQQRQQNALLNLEVAVQLTREFLDGAPTGLPHSLRVA
jgi:hypothetical protein